MPTPDEPPTEKLELLKGGAIWLYRDVIRILPKDGEAVAFSRETFTELGEPVPVSAKVMLVRVNTKPKKLALRLAPETWSSLHRWLGTEMNRIRVRVLRVQARIGLLLGIVIVLTSAPFSPGSMSVVTFLGGASMIITSLVTLVVHHRALFLVGALPFVAFFFDNMHSVLQGHLWSLIFAGFCVLVVQMALKQYRLYV